LLLANDKALAASLHVVLEVVETSRVVGVGGGGGRSMVVTASCGMRRLDETLFPSQAGGRPWTAQRDGRRSG
jgi:hypothetical protein